MEIEIFAEQSHQLQNAAFSKSTVYSKTNRLEFKKEENSSQSSQNTRIK